MTKLYNFAAIDDWSGRGCIERLHGGEIRFRAGFDATMRRELHREIPWEESFFRCLHLCFLKRSSLDQDGAPRKNIMDVHAWTWRKAAQQLLAKLTGKRQIDWKEEKYGRGPLVELSTEGF